MTRMYALIMLPRIRLLLCGLFLSLAALDLHSATYQLGDLAPRGAPDGALNAGDIVILQRLIFGELVPTADEIIIGDVAPFGMPDNVLNAADLLILQRAVLGQITLSTVTTDTSPPVLNMSAVSIDASISGQLTISGLSGATEDNVTINVINLSNGETASITSDISGGFLLTLAGNAGDNLFIFIVDGSGNTTNVEYVVGAIQILVPVDNSTVNDNTTNIAGVFTGSADTGILIAGKPACIKGNNFYLNNHQLSAGVNTIGAALTYQNKVTSSDNIEVISSGSNYVSIQVINDCGVAPLNATFDVEVDQQIISPLQIEIDYEGDGIIDSLYTSVPDPLVLSFEYTTEGIYIPKITVTDSMGTKYTEELYIVVQGNVEQSTIFEAIWDEMKARLAAGDRDGALVYVNPESHYLYAPVFDALMPNIAEILADWSGIVPVNFGSTITDYVILRVINGQVRTFVINFKKDSDGVWKIDSM